MKHAQRKTDSRPAGDETKPIVLVAVPVSRFEDTVKAMPVDFEPENDLDAFQVKLKEAIEGDDRNKALIVAGLVALVLFLASVAVIVTFNLLKSYAGSYIPTGPININPCKVGAFVNVANTQCVYVPCAVTDSQGNLAPGFFPTQDACLASFQSYFYPAAGTSP